jgi:hypothetical protein
LGIIYLRRGNNKYILWKYYGIGKNCIKFNGELEVLGLG